VYRKYRGTPEDERKSKYSLSFHPPSFYYTLFYHSSRVLLVNYRVSQKLAHVHCFVPLNFVKYRSIYTFISLSESGEH